MSLSPAFIWNAAAIALGVIGGVLFLWAMFWDRARGRLRCPKCWYDMKGAVEASVEGAPGPPWRCSECGRTVKALRTLKRPHRRPQLAAIALLLILIAFQSNRIRLAFTHRWPEAIPNVVLVFWPHALGQYEWTMSYDSGIGAPKVSRVTAEVQDEIHWRLIDGRFSRLDTWILTKRMRATHRKHGFIALSPSDTAAIERIRSARFTVHNELIDVKELRSAAKTLGLDLWDELEDTSPAIPWRPYRARYSGHDSSNAVPVGASPSTHEVSLAEALSGLMVPESWSATDGWIEIKPSEKLHRRIGIYNIRDLVERIAPLMSMPRSEARERVRDVIVESILFEWWAENGGDAATATPFGSRLMINAPPRVHAEVRDLLNALRTSMRSQELVPESTRADMDHLEAFASMSPFKGDPVPRTVGDVVEVIERASGSRVIWSFNEQRDEPIREIPLDIRSPLTMEHLCHALAAAATDASDETPATWTLDDNAIVIGAVLPTQWRVYSMSEIRGGMMRLAGSHVLVWDESMELVWHRITQEIDRPHWFDNGGKMASGRLIGDVLVISATPTMHARIGLLLQDIAADPPMPVASPPEDDTDPKNRAFDGAFDDD